MQEAGKLAMVLVQFPPWFDCIRAHVEEVRFISGELEGYDVAIEFRHQSWYTNQSRAGTVSLLRQGFIKSRKGSIIPARSQLIIRGFIFFHEKLPDQIRSGRVSITGYSFNRRHNR
jgi:hypothetical protein